MILILFLIAITKYKLNKIYYIIYNILKKIINKKNQTLMESLHKTQSPMQRKKFWQSCDQSCLQVLPFNKKTALYATLRAFLEELSGHSQKVICNMRALIKNKGALYKTLFEGIKFSDQPVKGGTRINCVVFWNCHDGLPKGDFVKLYIEFRL